MEYDSYEERIEQLKRYYDYSVIRQGWSLFCRNQCDQCLVMKLIGRAKIYDNPLHSTCFNVAQFILQNYYKYKKLEDILNETN